MRFVVSGGQAIRLASGRRIPGFSFMPDLNRPGFKPTSRLLATLAWGILLRCRQKTSPGIVLDSLKIRDTHGRGD